MLVIAFLGIGKMGRPMAYNLATAGFRVKCWNRTSEKLGSLPSILEAHEDLQRTIAGADVVISMLSDGSATKKVISKLENKVLSSIKTWIEMASVLPQEAIDQSAFFQKNNITYLDAPVSGGTVAANNRNLAIMVGGEDDVYKEAISLEGSVG